MDQSNAVRDGFLAAGVFTAIIFVSLLVPFAGLILLFFIPVPFAVYTHKYGWKAASITALFALIILSLVIGLLAPAFMLLFGAAGIAMGELYRRGEGAFGAYAGTALSVILGIVFTYAGTMALTDTDPVQSFQMMMEDSVEQTEGLLGIDENVDAGDEVMAFVDDVQVIVPALIVLFGAAIAFIMQIAASWYIRRSGSHIPRFPPFREWSFPKSFIWYYLLALILSFINMSEGQEGTLNTISANLMPVMETGMIIQGLAFMFFFFHLKKVTVVLPLLITGAAFVFPFLLPIIRILGIIDLGFDLRTRLKSQN